MITPNSQKPDGAGDIDSLVQRQADALQYGTRRVDRKYHARRRLDILNEDFRQQVAEWIENTHYDPKIRSRIKRHVSLGVNPAADITSALACVYKHGVRRSLGSASKSKLKALQGLNNESHWDELAQRINRLAWYVGPVLEVPTVANGMLRRDIVTADRFDILLDGENPMGQPRAVAFPWWRDGEWVIEVITDERYITYKSNGRDVERSEAHGVRDAEGKPMLPATVWRYDAPLSVEDWWSLTRNDRLTDGTIECAAIYSIMSWVRKSQNRRIITYFGNLERLGPDNQLDPEIPLTSQLEREDPAPIVGVHDNDTSPTNFISHIRFVYESLIESFGIPQSAVSFNFAEGGESGVPMGALAIQHDRLSALRNAQIPFARRLEYASQIRAVAVARAMNHPDADSLPTVEEVSQKLELDFPELARVEDPAKLAQTYDWKLSRGLTTWPKIYQLHNPHLTLEECTEAVRENLEAQAEFYDLVARRNMSPGAGVESLPQAQGREGADTRDQNKDQNQNGTEQRGGRPEDDPNQ